jgi:hypothetical protein
VLIFIFFLLRSKKFDLAIRHTAHAVAHLLTRPGVVRICPMASHITAYPAVMVGFFPEKRESAAAPCALGAIRATAEAADER